MLQNTAIAPGSIGNVIWPPFGEREHVTGPIPAVIRQSGDCANDQVHQHVTAVPVEHPSNLLVPSPTARNLHLVPPNQLDATINRHTSLLKQLKTFSSSFQDAYVPHDVLLPMLLEDMSDRSIRAARVLAGNCVAGCTVFSGNQDQHLAFSTCGQIGEQLLLTVLQQVDTGATIADTAPNNIQTVCTAQINLGKEILQIDIQPYSSHNPQLPHFQSKTAASIRNRPERSVGVWVLARSMYRVDVLWASCKHSNTTTATTGRTANRAAADYKNSRDWQLEWRGSVHLPYPAIHAKLHPNLPECLVLLNDGNVGLISLSPCSSVQSSQLQAPIPLKCSLLLSPDVLSRTKSRSGTRADSTLQENKVSMACTWGMQPRTVLLALQGSLWRCDIRLDAQGLPCSQPTLLNQLTASNMYLSLARFQRSRHSSVTPTNMDTMDSIAAGTSRQTATSTVERRSGAFGTQAKTSNGAQGGNAYQQQHMQDAYVTQTLLPYMAALTSTQVMLIDLRRPQGHVVATPHACTTYPPMYLNMQALQQVLPSNIRQVRKDQNPAGNVQNVQTPGKTAPFQDSLASQEDNEQLDQPSQQQTSRLSLPMQDAVQQHGDESQQHTPSVGVLLTWGTSQGAVYTWHLVIHPSSVQLALGQANTIASSTMPSSTNETASQLIVCHAARSFGQAPHRAAGRITTDATNNTTAGIHSRHLLASWQPACFDVVQSVGLVRQLCKPNSLKDNTRLHRLRKQRADMYSQDEPIGNNDGLGASYSAVSAFEAHYWGHQSDALSRRAELIKSHLQAAEHVPDLQGLAVLPLCNTSAAQVMQALPAALLLRSNFDGDLAVQQLQYVAANTAQSAVQNSSMTSAAVGSPAALPAHASNPQGQEAIESSTTAAALHTEELNRMPSGTVGPTASGLSSQLTKRYTGASHAARMLLGPQQGLLTPSSPRLRAHYYSFMQLLQAMHSSFVSSVGGVDRQPLSQLGANNNCQDLPTEVQQVVGATNTNHISTHNWQLAPRRCVSSILKITSSPAEDMQERLESSSLSYLLNHDSKWQEVVRDMVQDTVSTLTVGDVLLRLTRAVGTTQATTTHEESGRAAKRRKTPVKEQQQRSLLASGPYNENVTMKAGSRKGYVEQILQNSVSTAATSLSWTPPHMQSADKVKYGQTQDTGGGVGTSSGSGTAGDATKSMYGILACCQTASELLAGAQALQHCLKGDLGVNASTGKEVLAGTEKTPHSFVQSGIAVRCHGAPSQQMAVGTTHTAQEQDKQPPTIAELQLHDDASALTKTILTLHGTIIMRDQLLRPTTSQVFRADSFSSPVDQRQSQFSKKQFSGPWRIGMPQAALDTYHRLLDAWPEGPSAISHEGTQSQDTAVTNARFFVPGYESDANASSRSVGVGGGNNAKSVSTRVEPVRRVIVPPQGLQPPEQATLRQVQQAGSNVARQVQTPLDQLQTGSQPSTATTLDASVQPPATGSMGQAPSQGVVTDTYASQPQSQSQARPQLSAAARAALLERKRKAVTRAAEGF